MKTTGPKRVVPRLYKAVDATLTAQIKPLGEIRRRGYQYSGLSLTTINVFRGQGRSFLTSSPDKDVDNDSVIDISHESLIRRWPLLKTWVAEEARNAEI
jgi:hypothetical protein